MKQKKLTRKERKRLVDAELAKRGIDPDARRQRQGAVAGKMSWLSSFRSEEEASQEFAKMLIMSHSLADEPEMEDLLFDPVASVNALTEAVQELGLLTEDGSMSDWVASEDTQMDVQEKVTEKLLTKQIQRRFEDAVARLVKRLETTQDSKKLISASGVQMFMKSIKDKSGWATLGLVQEIVRRSIDAGFELLGFVDEQISEEQSLADIVRSLDDDRVKKSFEAVLGKIPGLRSHLEKEVDIVWDEGMEAIKSGDLDLGLFSPEELQGGMAIMAEAFQPQRDGEHAKEKRRKSALTDEQGKALMMRLEEYITGLFTPDRLEQLRTHLAIRVDEPGDDKSRLAFISMISLHMQEDNAVEEEMWLLMRVFFWEVRNYAVQYEAKGAVDDG